MNAGSNCITLNVNGVDRLIHDVPGNMSLADALRERLNLLGTKIACNEGACGACTVIMEGEAVLSCMVLAVTAEGKKILTIESLSEGGHLHPIQEAYLEERGFACGYCTPGFIMATKALLDKNPKPSEEMIKQALAGNICRCAIYEHIVDAAKAAARKMQEVNSNAV